MPRSVTRGACAIAAGFRPILQKKLGTKEFKQVYEEGGTRQTRSVPEGEEGFVYRGRLPVRIERTNLADVARPRTRMTMNVANPAEAFSLSFLPNDGVGLARLEFIIGTHVRAHRWPCCSQTG